MEVNSFTRTLLKMNISFFAVQLKSGHYIKFMYVLLCKSFVLKDEFSYLQKNIVNLRRKSGSGESLCLLGVNVNALIT